jgi:alpha-L-fucosidase
MKPDGSLDDGSRAMLKDVGDWMKINGEGIYGSHAWLKLGEGANGRIKEFPRGKIGAKQAAFHFAPTDFRFTAGSDGAVYAYCMAVPQGGSTVKIASMGANAGLLRSAIKSVTLLGSAEPLQWTQEPDALEITCPAEMPYKIAVAFKVTCSMP